MTSKNTVYISVNELFLSTLLLICGVSVGYFIGHAEHHSISAIEIAMMVFGCVVCCGALALRQRVNSLVQ